MREPSSFGRRKPLNASFRFLRYWVYDFGCTAATGVACPLPSTDGMTEAGIPELSPPEPDVLAWIVPGRLVDDSTIASSSR